VGVEVRRHLRTTPAALSPKPGGCWHTDEVVARIAGEMVYRWRVVDRRRGPRHLVQRGRDKAAALKLVRKLLKKRGWKCGRIESDRRSFANQPSTTSLRPTRSGCSGAFRHETEIAAAPDAAASDHTVRSWVSRSPGTQPPTMGAHSVQRGDSVGQCIRDGMFRSANSSVRSRARAIVGPRCSMALGVVAFPGVRPRDRVADRDNEAQTGAGHSPSWRLTGDQDRSFGSRNDRKPMPWATADKCD
jgi:hypothetical protein